MDKDIIKEINQYFSFNNTNIDNINKTVAILSQNVTDLKNIVLDLGRHVDFLEKIYNSKTAIKN